MLHHTENSTTVHFGQSVATVIADSVNANGKRITTLELVYPRYIHSELMTHRMFSRNASSSRATPLKVTLDEVRNDPVFFDYVGKNQSGMVAGEELTESELVDFQNDWEALGKLVANHVEYLNKRYNIHKQTLNRALEPWLRIRTLVTATEWDNFFKLRLAPDAQPEIQKLAVAMKEAMGKSVLRESDFHFPYVKTPAYFDFNDAKVSAARCARVSYAKLDGSETNVKDDLALADKLLESGHLSPFEHVAFSCGHRAYANFKGWQSYRNWLGE